MTELKHKNRKPPTPETREQEEKEEQRYIEVNKIKAHTENTTTPGEDDGSANLRY